MFTQIETKKPNAIAIKFEGKAESADYNKLLPLVESKIKEHEKINLYWELENFKGWDWQSLMEEIQFDISYINSFNRIAIVGDKDLEETVVDIIQPFVPADILYFPIEDRQKALQWIEA